MLSTAVKHLISCTIPNGHGWHLWRVTPFKRNIRGCCQSNPPSGLNVVSLGRFVVCKQSLMRLQHLVYGGRWAAWFGRAVWTVRTWFGEDWTSARRSRLAGWFRAEWKAHSLSQSAEEPPAARCTLGTVQSCTLARGFYWSILSLWMVTDEVIFIFHCAVSCAVWFVTFPFAHANALKAFSRLLLLHHHHHYVFQEFFI